MHQLLAAALGLLLPILVWVVLSLSLAAVRGSQTLTRLEYLLGISTARPSKPEPALDHAREPTRDHDRRFGAAQWPSFRRVFILTAASLFTGILSILMVTGNEPDGADQLARMRELFDNPPPPRLGFSETSGAGRDWFVWTFFPERLSVTQAMTFTAQVAEDDDEWEIDDADREHVSRDIESGLGGGFNLEPPGIFSVIPDGVENHTICLELVSPSVEIIPASQATTCRLFPLLETVERWHWAVSPRPGTTGTQDLVLSAYLLPPEGAPPVALTSTTLQLIVPRDLIRQHPVLLGALLTSGATVVGTAAALLLTRREIP